VNVNSRIVLQARDPATGNLLPGTWEVRTPDGSSQRTTQPQSEYAFTATSDGQWTIAFYQPGATTPAWTVAFTTTAPSQVTITAVQSTDPNVPVRAAVPSNVDIPVNVGSQITFQSVDPTTSNPLAGTWELTRLDGMTQQKQVDQTTPSAQPPPVNGSSRSTSQARQPPPDRSASGAVNTQV
jgi:hypothetical protein